MLPLLLILSTELAAFGDCFLKCMGYVSVTLFKLIFEDAQ